MLRHDLNSKDPYKRPSFSGKNKIKRFIWSISWKVLCSWTPVPFHSWRILILRFFGGKIGKSNFVYPDCRIWAPWLLETEDVVTIGSRVEIYNPAGLFLGHHSILSQDSYICGATHDFNNADFTYIKEKNTIESYVWICARAIVLSGVSCKQGSVLGAGSITSKDLESWTVYAGAPAKPVKKRVNHTEKYNLSKPLPAQSSRKVI